MTNLVLIAGIVLLSGAPAPRENRRGLEALDKGDTAAALKHLEKAAKSDTSDARFAYNLGTVRARTGKGSPDEALSQALAHAKTPEEKARILYNRGTARYRSAKAKHEAQATAAPAGMAPPRVGRNPSATGGSSEGQDGPENEVNGAIDDLRQSLKIKPQWNEAARNLDLALRLRQQCKKPKPDDKNKDKQPPKDQPQQQPPPAMPPPDAQRLLDAAQAQENSQAKKPTQKKEQADGPDW
jgi:tetratricopeptide (TPR) repeat protein